MLSAVPWRPPTSTASSRRTAFTASVVRRRRRPRVPARLVSVGLLARADLPRRGHPQGRAAATSARRTSGAPTAARSASRSIFLDVLKGFVPAFLGVAARLALCGILAGAAAMVGHYRPLFLRLREGREDGRDGRRRPLRASRRLRRPRRRSGLADRLPADALRIGRVDRRPRSRRRSWAWAFGYPTSVIVLRERERGRGDLPAPREPAAAARRHREPVRHPTPATGTAVADDVAAQHFPRLVTLACHDLRTPLATVYGFAKTLRPHRRARRADAALRRIDRRRGRADRRPARRARAGSPGSRADATSRCSPQVDTLALATSTDERVTATGDGRDRRDRRVGAAPLARRPRRRQPLRHGELESVDVDRERPRAHARAGQCRMRRTRDQRRGPERPRRARRAPA